MHIPITVISLLSPSLSGSRGICTLTGPVTGIAVPKLTHTYDANGNLITDATRGIDSIRYNVLNLPETVFFHSGYRLNYTYLADGTKLRETRRRPSFSIGTGSSGILLNATDYIGPYEIEDGVPARLQLPGGHMTLSDNVYHHYIPDYQGNILGVINTATRTMEQYSEYYPYGMPFGRSSGAGLNRRKYSGKELVTFGGYNAMDYHARWRPTLYPMFTTPDPLGETYTNTSLYTYCGGDPVNMIDPSGCDEIEMDNKLKVLNYIVTDQHDAFYILDIYGNRNIACSAEMPYGTVDWASSSFSINDDEVINGFDKYVVRGDEDGLYLFYILASSSTVEVSHIQTGADGKSGINYITTSHSTTTDYGHNGVFNEIAHSQQLIRSMTHSHTNGLGLPSGIFIDDGLGDVQAAGQISRILGYSPKFNIYDIQMRSYISYGIKTSYIDFGLPSSYKMYNVIYRGAPLFDTDITTKP